MHSFACTAVAGVDAAPELRSQDHLPDTYSSILLISVRPNRVCRLSLFVTRLRNEVALFGNSAGLQEDRCDYRCATVCSFLIERTKFNKREVWAFASVDRASKSFAHVHRQPPSRATFIAAARELVMRRIRRRWARRRRRLAVALVLAHLISACFAFESMVDAAREVVKDGPKRPLRTAHALHSLYPRTDALLSRVRELAAGCEAATVGSVRVDGGALEYVTLTRRKGYMQAHILKRRTRVCFAFGESGRESFVTSQVALEVLESVCGGGKSGIEGLSAVAERVLDFSEIVLVPLVNVAGRRVAEAGGWCEVGNGRDVDLNRNYAESWGLEPEVDDPKKDPYPRRERLERGNEPGGVATVSASVAGAAAFSEWESRAMRTLVTYLRPSAYVSVQSGYGVSVSAPGECRRRDAPRGAELASLRAVGDLIVAKHCWTCGHENFLDLTGRGRCGSGVDWMYKVLGGEKGRRSGKPAFIYTWRVYANVAATPLDCLRAFNPITKDVLKSVSTRWGHAMFSLVEAVHGYRMDLREHGAEKALQNASRQAAALMAKRPLAGSMVGDEKEVASAASVLSQVHPDGVLFDGHKRRGLEHSGVDVKTVVLSVLVMVGCVLCLFYLRKAMFSGTKSRRGRPRTGGYDPCATSVPPRNLLKVL